MVQKINMLAKRLLFVMKSVIKRILGFFIPLTNTILLESFPDFSDSMINVYNELINRGINTKYRLVWYVTNNKKNCNFRTTHTRLFRFLAKYSAKVIITSNRIIYSVKRKQKCFYISHGNTIKQVKDYYYFKGRIDYFICLSENTKELNANQMHFDVNKTYGLGLPRNDDLVIKKRENFDTLVKMFGNFDKYVFWYPTVKTFKNGKTHGSGLPFPFYNDLKVIDDFAKKHKVLICLKIHFAQINRELDFGEFTNIKLFDDAICREHNVSPYELLALSDCLITDYSSVFYDYLLVDKPICLIWSDYNSYSLNPGLTDDFIDFDSKCAEKAYSISEFLEFLKKIVNNEDDMVSLRQDVFKRVFNCFNGPYTKNFCDFFCEHTGIKNDFRK